MNQHNWLNRVSREVWFYNVTSLCFFWWAWLLSSFAEAENYVFFSTKMVLVLLPESLLGWRIYKPRSEMVSISNSTDFVSVPNDEYVSLPTNTSSYEFFFFSLQAAFFRFLFCIFPSAQICHKLKFCNIITPNKKQTNNKAGKTKKKTAMKLN